MNRPCVKDFIKRDVWNSGVWGSVDVLMTRPRPHTSQTYSVEEQRRPQARLRAACRVAMRFLRPSALHSTENGSLESRMHESILPLFARLLTLFRSCPLSPARSTWYFIRLFVVVHLFWERGTSSLPRYPIGGCLDAYIPRRSALIPLGVQMGKTL